MPSDLEYDNDWGYSVSCSNVEERDLLPVVDPSARPEVPVISQQLLRMSCHSRLNYGHAIKAAGSENQQGDGESKKDYAHSATK